MCVCVCVYVYVYVYVYIYMCVLAPPAARYGELYKISYFLTKNKKSKTCRTLKLIITTSFFFLCVKCIIYGICIGAKIGRNITFFLSPRQFG